MDKVHDPSPAPPPTREEQSGAPLINRCPFCHEGVTPETSAVCRGCLTRHHDGCWSEGGGKCSSCGGTRRFEPEKLTLGRAVQLLEAQGYPAEQIKALLQPQQVTVNTEGGSVLVRRLIIPVLLMVIVAVLVAVPAIAVIESNTRQWDLPSDVRFLVVCGFMAAGVFSGFLALLAALRKG